jgi:hypothetical protein
MDYGEVRLPVVLDDAGFQSDWTRLERQINAVADIPIKLTLDSSDLLRQLKAFDIGKQLDVKVNVNDAALTKLNRHLDAKDAHVRQLQQTWDAKPLSVRVQTFGLDSAFNQISQLERRLKSLDSKSATVRASISSPDVAESKQASRVGSDVAKSISKELSKIKAPKTGGIGSLLSAPFALIADSVKGVALGSAIGVGQTLSKDFAEGFTAGFSPAAAVAPALLGKKAGEGLSAFVDGVTGIDTTQLQAAIAAIG